MVKRLSRHRLPPPYRALLALFWATPVVLLFITLIATHGLSIFLLDLRLLLPLGFMLLPAWYVWRQGVDVVENGIIVNNIVSKHYVYTQLGGWQLVPTPQGYILTIWCDNQAIVLQVHAAHLSALSILLDALTKHLSD